MKGRVLALLLIVALLIPTIPAVAAPPSNAGTPSTADVPADLVHELVVGASADTWVNGWLPTTNYGTRGEMYVRSGGVMGALLKFDISAIPIGATVVDAQLTIRGAANVGNPHRFTVSAYQVYRDWSEGEATWLNATAADMWGIPGLGDMASDRAATSTYDFDYPVDLTAFEEGTGELFIRDMVQDWVADPAVNFGVYLGMASTKSMQIAIASSDNINADKHPQLKVVYTTYPVADKGTALFKDSADTWISEYTPNTNYEGRDRMKVRTSGISNALVQFPLDTVAAGIPQGAYAAKAYLWVYAYEDMMSNHIIGGDQAVDPVAYGLQSPYDLEAYAVTTPWAASTASWKTPWTTPGGDAGAKLGSATVNMPFGWVQLDVTEAVAAWLEDPAANNGLMLKAVGDQNAEHAYLTSEWGNAAYRPTLVVHWVEKPADFALNVVSTNDFHGALSGSAPSWAKGDRVGSLQWIAGYYNILRALNPGGVIVLDAGDEMQGTLESNYYFGESTIAGYNAMGVMAATFGNHEFDWGIPKLLERVAQANYPYVSCNIRLKADGSRPEWAQPYTYLDVKGVKVGIIGVAEPTTGSITNPVFTGHLDFTNPATEVNAVLDEVIAGGATVVIVNAHLGGYAPDYADVAALANALDPSKVDLIISGHSHSAIATKINGIPVIQSFNNGTAFGRVDLMVDPWFETVTSSTVQPTQNTYNTFNKLPATYEGQTVVKDTAVEAVIQPYLDGVAVLKATVIGETTVPLVRAYRLESNIGDWLTDAMRNYDATVDFAMTNSGGIRADVDTGPITFGEWFAVMPFGNSFTKVWVTGAQLIATLEDGITAQHGIIQQSGLKFTFNYDLPAHSRIIGDVIDARTNTPIDPTATYVILVNNFMASGGDHYGTLPLCPQEQTYVVDIDYFAAYLTAHSPIGPVIDGRTTALGTPPP